MNLWVLGCVGAAIGALVSVILIAVLGFGVVPVPYAYRVTALLLAMVVPVVVGAATGAIRASIGRPKAQPPVGDGASGG